MFEDFYWRYEYKSHHLLQIYVTINLLDNPIPAAATPARHKNRHMAISREPSVVSLIRWCQNDRKKLK